MLLISRCVGGTWRLCMVLPINGPGSIKGSWKMPCCGKDPRNRGALDLDSLRLLPSTNKRHLSTGLSDGTAGQEEPNPCCLCLPRTNPLRSTFPAILPQPTGLRVESSQIPVLCSIFSLLGLCAFACRAGRRTDASACFWFSGSDFWFLVS